MPRKISNLPGKVKVLDVLHIKTIPDEVAPEDFKRFIQDKFEYKDPMGEHIYSLQSIYLGRRYLIPPGEILDFFEEIKIMLQEEQCDYFTLVKWKNLLRLNYMKDSPVRLLVISKEDMPQEFLAFISDKYEYKDPMRDHLYSLESIWLSAKEVPESCKAAYFSVWEVVRQYGCSLFTFVAE